MLFFFLVLGMRAFEMVKVVFEQTQLLISIRSYSPMLSDPPPLLVRYKFEINYPMPMRIKVPISFFVAWKCHWSAVEVSFKCKHPTATATDLWLLTPSLSTVSWSKIALFNNLEMFFYNPFFKFCHHRPILGLRSLTKGLLDTRQWVFHNVTNTQTDGHCDSLTGQPYLWSLITPADM